MDAIYRYQRYIYDASRKYYLLGRDRMLEELAPAPGGTVLEIACGTGRNLIKAAGRYPDAIAAIGLSPEARITNGGLDANWLNAHGLPTVTLGCGQQDIHTVNETLHIESYLQACRIGLLLATAST